VTREDLRGWVECAGPDALPEVLGALEEARALGWARLQAPSSKPVTEGDVNVSIREAARRLAVSDRWLYKNAKRLPFVRRFGRRVVCSTRGLAEWASRQRA
jgi:hypothetical protein